MKRALAAWAVAAAAGGLLAGRMAALPAKGAAAPLDDTGRPVMSTWALPPGIPPDPGRGPTPCRVIYVSDAGQESCLALPSYGMEPAP